MVAHTVTTYTCDRCGKQLPDEKPSDKLSVDAYQEGEWAPELKIAWRHFCMRCSFDVVQFLKEKPNAQ